MKSSQYFEIDIYWAVVLTAMHSNISVENDNIDTCTFLILLDMNKNAIKNNKYMAKKCWFWLKVTFLLFNLWIKSRFCNKKAS